MKGVGGSRVEGWNFGVGPGSRAGGRVDGWIDGRAGG